LTCWKLATSKSSPSISSFNPVRIDAMLLIRPPYKNRVVTKNEAILPYFPPVFGTYRYFLKGESARRTANSAKNIKTFIG